MWVFEMNFILHFLSVVSFRTQGSLGRSLLSGHCKSSVLVREASFKQGVSAKKIQLQSPEQRSNAKGLNGDNQREFSSPMGDSIQSLGVPAVVNGFPQNFGERKATVQSYISIQGRSLCR